jgi:desulfoferrodoxin (superoxide reductase-like protein)
VPVSICVMAPSRSLLILVVTTRLVGGRASLSADIPTLTRAEVPLTRRTFTSAATAATATAVLTGSPRAALASKFPQHVEDLDRAARAGDGAAVRTALRTLGIPSDDQAVAITLKPVGDAGMHVINCGTISKGLSSAKIPLSMEMHPMQPEHFVRFMWLRNNDTGGLVAVRELKPGVEAALLASVPKGLGVSRVTPCAFCSCCGVWTGSEIELAA